MLGRWICSVVCGILWWVICWWWWIYLLARFMVIGVSVLVCLVLWWKKKSVISIRVIGISEK